MELLFKSQYSLLALLELTACYSGGEPLQIRQMATLQNIPNRYLEQQLMALKRGGLIKSIRGVKGGYVLAREPGKITLLDAFRCVEGLDAAPLTKNSASKTEESKIIHEIWQEVREAANSVLQQYTLQDLYDQRAARQQTGIMYYI